MERRSRLLDYGRTGESGEEFRRNRRRRAFLSQYDVHQPAQPGLSRCAGGGDRRASAGSPVSSQDYEQEPSHHRGRERLSRYRRAALRQVRERPQVHLMQSVNEDGRTWKDLGASSVAGWAYDYGKGRVCYLAPGHLMAALWNPEYEKIQRNAVKWLLREI